MSYTPYRPLLGTGDIIQDAWGVQKVSLPSSLYHGMFTFNIPPSMWFMYENGTQVYTSTDIVSSGCAAVLTTSATNTALVLESRECPRYQPNRGHLFSTAVWCPNKTNDGVREWGLRTTENGVFFRLKADGLLYAVLRSGNVETYESVIDTSDIAGFDVEKGNVYDIQFQWRGVGNYKFFINLTEVHLINNLGTLTTLSMQNPSLPVSFRATRTTQDVSISIGCADISSENGLTDKEQYRSAFIENASVNGTYIPVLSIRSPLTIGGNTNTRTNTLARITVTSSKKAYFRVWVTRDSSAVVGATFQQLTSGSFIECDSPSMNPSAVTATSYNTALMEEITVIPVEALVSRSVDSPYRGRIEFPFVRGDYLLISCEASAANADVVVEWGEQI